MAELTKNLVDRLKSLEGEARGMHLKSDGDYVLKKKGEEGLEKLERRLEELGCPIRYRKVKNLGFYPIGYRPISLLAIKDVFGWDDGEVRKMCGYAAGASLIVRLYMKFFYSISKITEKGPEIYDEYFTKGRLRVSDPDLENKELVIRVEDLDLHPVYCRCMEGYLKEFVKMVVREDEAECKERECSFEKGEAHEFVVTWR